MKTVAKSYLMTVSRLAKLQKEGKIYLDEAFQSHSRWTIALNQAYMRSVIEGQAVTPITLGKISSLLESIEIHYGPTHSDYEFFKSLLEQGYEYITIDGNNRDNCVCNFLDDVFPLIVGTYQIEHNNMLQFSTTKDCKYYSSLDSQVRNYIDNVGLNILLITQSDRVGLSKLFSNINAGLTLNDQEKRNAIASRFGCLVRETVKENIAGLKKIYNSKKINRRAPDEFIVTVSNLVANGMINIDKNSRDRAYGDGTVEVISFNKTKKIIKQIADIALNYNSTGFNVGGKFNNNLVDFAILLHYMNDNSIVINDMQKFYNFFIKSQGDRLNSEEIIFNNKKGTNPRTYAGVLRSNGKNYLMIRQEKLIESLKDIDDGVLSFRDEDRFYDPKIRYQLWKRQNGFCAITGEYIEPLHIYDGKVTHIDHSLPWSKGGETILENAQLTLASANILKSNNEFIEVQSL